MNPYSIALFTHFFGLVGLFVGYGLEWAASSLLRSSTTSDQARAWLRIYKLSLPISGPGLLILIVSGGYLASITGGMKQGWISASLLAIVLALGIGFVFLLPRVRRIRAALPEATVTLPDAILARVQDPMVVTLIRVRFVLALGIVYLMTAKPESFATSFFILLGAIVVGLFCAAASWSSRPASAKA
ncbi:MAG: DUF2269 family protein [Candidatus Acidiferrum sp.]